MNVEIVLQLIRNELKILKIYSKNMNKQICQLKILKGEGTWDVKIVRAKYY